MDRALKPLRGEAGQGIEVRIKFDGHVFEIRKYSADRLGARIFRGEL
jgi:hypothetical protein